jgi:hypothetical protein
MRGRIWQVWTEIDGVEQDILFEGNSKEAHKYYKQNGGSKSGLHIGYLL